MHFIDFTLFMLYMCAVFAVGAYFYRKNKSREDYFVGGRKLKPFHIGLSVAATDVGGGFSIGLGGLAYVIGLSGSWLLFTGLLGAWLSAVFLIPRVKKVDSLLGMMTFPDFLRHKYGERVALIAALISGIGYLGFTGAQILAGAKLSSAALFSNLPFDIDPMLFSLLLIAVIILLYTSLGGLKAVVYTDTVQWIILICGLTFLAAPFAIYEMGGFGALKEELPPGFLSLTNVRVIDLINWMITIVPIWFVAMTLYQRIYACRTERDAKKAWYIAGFFEYPIMAFVGAFLGMCSRVFFPEVEPEMGLPLLLRDVLPIGIKGIVIAAYFSAIMSTADSCLLASSGNFLNDILHRYFFKNGSKKLMIRLSQLVTLVIGIITVLIAISFESVLEIILYAYSFMVAGLLAPTLAAVFSRRKISSTAAMISMLGGGTTALFIIFSGIKPPFGLDASFYGFVVSGFLLLSINYYLNFRSTARG